LRDLRFSESHLVLLLYLTSQNKGSKNPQSRRRFQNFLRFAKGFKSGAISSIAHKLASNKGPLVARGMKRLKGSIQILIKWLLIGRKLQSAKISIFVKK